MTRQEIIERLKDDNDYYGEFGRNFLSNSDIQALLENPLEFKVQKPKTVALLTGGYFHTYLLEKDKINKYKIVDATTRNTNKYKEMSDGELTLLQHEVDEIELLTDLILENDACRNLIREGDVEYEVPNIVELEGQMWKCKADVINHSEKLVIDLKTTSDIERFRMSAQKYNYDSQAYIYNRAFGYDFIFIVICKKTKKIGIYDCSERFLESGANKVRKASEVYDLFFNTEDFDPKQYFINETL